MSSRALRKLQKLQEQEHANDSPDDLDDSLHSLHSFQKPQPKFNAFELLESQDAEDKSDSETSIPEPIQTPEKPSTPSKPLDTKKRKKKKKRVKKAASPIESKPAAVPHAEESELDEIDLALKALSAKQPLRNDVSPLDSDQNSWRIEFGRPSEEPDELLAIDPRRLNAINEMKKLFGNVVLESTNEASSAGAGRRNRNQPLDLGRALMGRYNPVSRGKDLAGATLRKNVLMQAKDEWPRATSGGLGMEVVRGLHSDRAEYKLVHNKAYEDAQRQFDLCVESMEPERMIYHLQYNPYHISSLLQVSEIAKHQGDHAVSGDLLERALFTIGRSVHSSFGTRLKQGKSRLNFNIAANREFWLSGWRYIKNLEMKGTLKTAYEWAKLLLSLDPGDPYAINLIIDSLAIRGREHDHFIKLCSHPYFSKRWENFLNIQCSLALAYLLQGKPVEGRSQLRKAMSHYPWVFCRLSQELNIEPIPKSIWAVQSPNETHCLFCELYIARAKDIWNTPEAISVLVEVADTLTKSKEEVKPPEITLDIARHVLLSDIPSVTTHLPHHFSTERMSASDPLPPGPEMDLSPNTHPAWVFDDARQLFGFPGQEAVGDVENEPEVSEDEEPTDRRQTGGDGDEVEDQADDDLSSPEEYLFNRGLQDLQDFLLVNGVDRGNWNADDDSNSVTVWVRRLRRLDREVWDSVIRDAAAELDSPLVADLLLDELQLQEEDVNR
ncbi:Nulp1-pending protein [Paracoccidioides lutzii Pb01]|uniref:Nulp1-pending protein n=1 Tax=Paracoccidioides lutzii (strain ATCC MYA-826 / Pb01) TaxID=502779 RepID=C1HAX1_PARBA|nr:Nulp1-pending protein [Paracoccidioides lutzii Pb01]EEH37417.1 Nulp1-pending protein [Paracoccidioides lutzii Pb01]